jgi:hypothetical protein
VPANPATAKMLRDMAEFVESGEATQVDYRRAIESRWRKGGIDVETVTYHVAVRMPPTEVPRG